MIIMITDDEVYDSFLYRVCHNCDYYKQCKEQDFTLIDNCIDGREINNMELFIEERDL